MNQHKIETVHGTGMEFNTDLNGHTLTIDASQDFGGNNAGPSPKILLLNSLSGCTGMDVISMLNKMRAKYSHFSIVVSGHLTDEHPVVYHTIKVEYRIKMPKSEYAKMEKAVKLSVERYCGVSAMIAKAAIISHEITFLV